VALCDQWYLKYSDEEWKNAVRDFVKSTFTCPSTQGYQQVLYTIDWLKDWGCSRSYGLGTKLPFDKQFLIESLSDSTIYMSYYTISYML
jgi:leucyl-tRNA synthetase